MPEQKLGSTLTIHDYELFINIGVGESEREKKQRILFSIDIAFQDVPKASVTDDIEDTICYHKVCDQLRDFNDRSFKTLEALAQENFTFIQNIFQPSNVKLKITKFPDIANLRGSISFTLYNSDRLK